MCGTPRPRGMRRPGLHCALPHALVRVCVKTCSSLGTVLGRCGVCAKARRSHGRQMHCAQVECVLRRSDNPRQNAWSDPTKRVLCIPLVVLLLNTSAIQKSCMQNGRATEIRLRKIALHSHGYNDRQSPFVVVVGMVSFVMGQRCVSGLASVGDKYNGRLTYIEKPNNFKGGRED